MAQRWYMITPIPHTLPKRLLFVQLLARNFCRRSILLATINVFPSDIRFIYLFVVNDLIFALLYILYHTFFNSSAPTHPIICNVICVVTFDVVTIIFILSIYIKVVRDVVKTRLIYHTTDLFEWSVAVAVHKDPGPRSLGVFFDARLNNLLKKQSSYQSFETAWRSWGIILMCTTGKRVAYYQCSLMQK